MAIIYYPSGSFIYKRDTTVGGFSQEYLSTSPNTILYIDSGSTLSQISSSILDLSCSYATSASWAPDQTPETASYATEALHAETASYAVSASYEILVETSASYSDYAATAGTADSATSSSFATSASWAPHPVQVSASYAETSSQAIWSDGAGLAANADQALTASYILASNVDGTVATSVSSSHALNADLAVSAAFSDNSTSASYSKNADVSQTALTSNTSSHSTYAETAGSADSSATSTSASYSDYAGVAYSINFTVETSSYALTAGNAAYAVNADTAAYVYAGNVDGVVNYASEAVTAQTASYMLASGIEGAVASAVSSSHADVSDLSYTADTATTAVSSSHALNADLAVSSAFADNSTSASYSVSASWAPGGDSTSASYAGTASYAQYLLARTPTNFTGSVDSTQTTITWSSNNIANIFVSLQKSIDSGSNWTELTATTASSYVDSDVTQSFTMWYKAAGVGINTSSFTSQLEVLTPVTPFSPSDIPGMVVWYEAPPSGSDLAIPAIGDKTVNGCDITQGTGASQPLSKVDASGSYYAEFDGGDDNLYNNTTFASGEFSTTCVQVVVMRVRTPDTQQDCINLDPAASDMLMRYTSANGMWCPNAVGTADVVTCGNVARYWVVIRNQGAEGAVYSNGTYLGLPDNGSAASVNEINFGSYRGSSGAGQNGSPAAIDLYEYIHYSGSLDSGSRADLDAYFQAKYPCIDTF